MTKRERRAARIGAKMLEVGVLVHERPGVTPLAVAEAVGPYGSRRYGYAVVWRAVRARLVSAIERDDKPGCYRLYPPDYPEARS